MMPPTVARASQSPTAYLTGAIDWLQANYVYSDPLTGQRCGARHWPSSTARALPPIPTGPSPMSCSRLATTARSSIPRSGARSGPCGYWAKYPGGRVFYVHPGSPADRAGIQQGDVIVSLNGQPVHRAAFSPYISQPSGDAMRVDCGAPARHIPSTSS